MPINFEQAAIRQPKIDIVGKEVPLAALEKTGDVLQGRFDKSYEDYNKFQELSAQTEQIADPLERQKVKDYIESFQPEIKKISEAGDFHNMRWQTQALANRAANNLALVGKRAETIGKIRESINTAENLHDPKAKAYYEALLNEEVAKTTYDADRKTFNFQSINTPKIVGDFNFADALLKSGAGWHADTDGYTNGDIQVLQKPILNKDGTIARAPGVYDITSGKKVSEVRAKEVLDNIQKIVMAAPGAKESLDRDVKIFMKDHPDADPDKVYESVYDQKVRSAAEGVSEKEGYQSIETVYDRKVASEAAQKLHGYGATPNQPYFENLNSTPVPSENSPVVQDLLNNDKIGIEESPLPVSSPSTAKYMPQIKFVVQGMHDEMMRLNKSKDPEDLKKLDQLRAAGASGIWLKIQKGETVTNKDVFELKKVLKNVSVPMTSAYQFMPPSDARFVAELNTRYKDAIGNPVKQMENLNAEVFGDAQGIDISKKNDNYTLGNLAGYDILDPETNEYNTLTQALAGKGDGLTLPTPTEGDTKMKITSKALPGSVLHGLSDNPQGDLSHFGTGYVVSINGRNYIMANRANRGSRNAQLNDLAGFSRIARNPIKYRTSDGKEVEIKSDGESVYLKGKKIQKDKFNQLIDAASQSGGSIIDVLNSVK